MYHSRGPEWTGCVDENTPNNFPTEVVRQPIGLQGKALSNVRGECGDYNNNNIVASIFNQPLVGERLLFPDPKL